MKSEHKENKDIQIKVRISATDKLIIDSYCQKNNLTISNFLRLAILNMISQ